jgi:hypothetical protein
MSNCCHGTLRGCNALIPIIRRYTNSTHTQAGVLLRICMSVGIRALSKVNIIFLLNILYFILFVIKCRHTICLAQKYLKEKLAVNKINRNAISSIILTFLLATGLPATAASSSQADRLIALADGFLVSRGLYAVAELGLADHLIAAPKTAQELAQELGLHAASLFRLLRMLAAHEVFDYQEGDLFALNDMSYLLTTDHPQSLRGFLLHEDEARWQAYGQMSYTLKTGSPAFNHLFGEGYFDYIARDKKRSEQFDQGMAAISHEENKQIVNAIDFSCFHHVVDIGGGVGGLLVALLQKYPLLNATLYELAHVKPLAEQITLVSGNFLESVVPGGDLYILKRVLHDWDDEACIKILHNCRQAMGNKGRMLVCECIVPEGDGYDISKDIDIILMVVFGGKERTRKEFEQLFNAAGLKIDQIISVEGSMLAGIAVSAL